MRFLTNKITVFIAMLVALAMLQPLDAAASDPAGAFLRGYTEFQNAERLEAAGNPEQALAKYRYAAGILEQISRENPEWQPLVVQYRLRKINEAILRVERDASTRTQSFDPLGDESAFPEGSLPRSGGRASSGFAEQPFPEQPDRSISSPRSSQQSGDAARLREENRLLREQLAQRTAELKSAMHEVDKTRVTVVELRHELAQARTKLEDALKDVTSVEQIRKTFADQLAEVAGEIEKTRAERDVLEEENERLHTKLEQASAYITQSDEIRKTLEEERKSFYEGREAARADRDKIQTELDAALADLKESREKLSEIEVLAAENKNLKAQAEAAASTIADLTSRVEAGDKALAELQEKLLAAESAPDSAEMVAKLAAAEQRILDLEASRVNAAEIEAKLAAAEEKLAQSHPPDSQENQDLIASLQTEVHTVNDRLFALRSELAARDNRIAALEKQLDETAAQLTELRLASPADTSAQQALVENELLRNILLRELKEQARRQQAKRLIEEEISGLQIQSASLQENLSRLGTGIELTEEEKILFRIPVALIEETSPESMEVSIAFTKPADSDPAEPTEQAEQLAEPSAEAPPESPSSPQGLDNLSQPLKSLAGEAQRAFERGNLEAAEQGFFDLAVQSPDNFYLLSQLGATQFQSGKTRAAEISIRKALELNPQDPFALSILGVICFRQGKFDEAESALLQSIDLDPTKARTYNYLGIVYSQNNKFPLAEEHLQRAIAIDPKYAEAHFNLAVIYATQDPPALELARKHYFSATTLGAEPDRAMDRLLQPSQPSQPSQQESLAEPLPLENSATP